MDEIFRVRSAPAKAYTHRASTAKSKDYIERV